MDWELTSTVEVFSSKSKKQKVKVGDVVKPFWNSVRGYCSQETDHHSPLGAEKQFATSAQDARVC